MLDRWINDVRISIRCTEGFFAALVLADFHDDLDRQETDQDRINLCKRWMNLYTLGAIA